MRRQLMKLLLPSEQARTMVFQTAEALRRADTGDAQAMRLARILTPLIKFRACRDARKVTGDAMEVRGGCGYIEEWIDPPPRFSELAETSRGEALPDLK